MRTLKLLSAIADIIVPHTCPLCAVVGYSVGFCSACSVEFTPPASPHCDRCQTPFTGTIHSKNLCSLCIKEAKKISRSFSTARSACVYDGNIRKAITRFKYHNQTEFSLPLALLTQSLVSSLANASADVIIMPVPLHKRRLKKRGFNQSLMLARRLSKSLSLSLDYKTLMRVRDTTPQVELTPKERVENVKNAFGVTNAAAIKDKKIIIIDDVYTTGATLSESAKELMSAGASDVIAVTVARTALV
ncbi:MAG: ComF family protein [Deltaproteobacteria bacterium]|nr:ComF family protein [Deltaproteobacteria bacterium]